MTFSATYLRIELVRQLRDGFTLAFTLALPSVMYLIFGAGAEWGSTRIGDGNVAFSVMVSMAAYGTVTAMTSLTASSAAESVQGWGRQLAMTPLGNGGYTLTKVLVALSYSVLSVAVVYVLGAMTGAEAGAAWVWFACAGITLGLGTIYGLYGLAVGLVFKSETATGLASALLTFFAFFGNVFMPLSGVMLTIAHFTPLYGVVALARWPLTQGRVDETLTDPLWQPVLNVVVWALVFLGLALYGVKRTRGRK
ncbi:ABC transporter permease [Brevibacterium sp. 50QC2O2]|uniref:ABC transporter permease n=1 Tax=Brevibacterium sp. 50QC2O2 TaxID=2968459 RepID=UPI00211C0D96|nr:ABC transporter permease [Brevibacterium sp. 50QC2O2]MCQ9389948.1 ABC transporter permease [Brevibacterium sp. 50QC2O2]